MNYSSRRILNCIFASLIISFAGIAHAANTNTTIQEGKININITHQCGDNNDNVTYQTGKVNINKTVQGCGKNRTKQGQAGQVNLKRLRSAVQQANSKPMQRLKRRERERAVRRANDDEGDN